MSDPTACDRDIYENGRTVFVTTGPDSAGIEGWVSMVREISGQPVDWHYMGGRGVVRTTGDVLAVRRAIVELMPEHERLAGERRDRDFGDLGGYRGGSGRLRVDENGESVY